MTTKERSTDRVLVLKPKAGEEVKSSKGMVDPRLFNGENKLHAIMDGQNLLWSFKYEFGGLPEPLKQSFTNFTLALDHAKKYFESRGIEIVEIQD